MFQKMLQGGGGGSAIEITKIETNKIISSTTDIDCTQKVKNYRDLTKDNFFLDVVSIFSASNATISVKKTYNASTGILTVTRGNGIEPTCDIYCVG